MTAAAAPRPAALHAGELRWEVRLLAVVAATLVAFGLAAMYGAASLEVVGGRSLGTGLFLRQLAGATAGGVLLLVAARVDYRMWRPVAWPLILGAVALLLLLLLPLPAGVAPTINGARRWLRLGPVTVQPSEVARLGVIVWCAMLAAKKGDQVRDFKKGTLPFLVVLGIVAALVLKQPNLSMATVIVLLGGIVLFAAGARIGHFLVLAVLGALALWQLILFAPYRLRRIVGFLGSEGDPDAAFQAQQSVIGIGSGGLLGVGFGEGQQKLGYLPYAYSDFLFSTIGEEWGFVGVCVVLGLYATFCWVGLRIARTAPDPFGMFLATGLTASVAVTALLHMGVTLALLPTTGLTLPFMSYGSSSLVITLLGTGILISIGRARGRPARR